MFIALLALGCFQEEGVLDKYEDQIEEAAPVAPLPQQYRLDAAMLGNILGEVDRLEADMLRMNQAYQVSDNKNTGLYTVEQERDIARSYARYLTLRKALFHIAFRHKDYAAIEDSHLQDQGFLLAYAAGLSLYRNAVVFVSLFKDQPNARRKLNEGHPVLGIPPGMYEEMYSNITAKDNIALVIAGMAELEARRSRLATSPLLEAPGLAGLLERLERNEDELEQAYVRLSEGKRDVLWTTLRTGVAEPAYKAQSFVSTMVSRVRAPVVDKGLSPQTVRTEIEPLLKPGDLLLTRRDGYLTNTFLPGNWGHAALYLGTPEQLRTLAEGAELSPQQRMAFDEALATYVGKDNDGFEFRAIEAIGEGVRFSSLEFALHANLVAVLRLEATDEQVLTAATRAIALRGTPYDFDFDLSSQDKIICTELVYRAYAPLLDLTFEDVMGTKTLKPDGMLRALAPGTPGSTTQMVLFGRSKDGALERGTAAELMATVQ